MKIILTLLIMFLFFIVSAISINALCTVTLDKTEYIQISTVTVNGICDHPSEQGIAGFWNFTNASGVVLSSISIITPLVKNTFFFESFQINSSYIADAGGFINISLSDGGAILEGKDSATVIAATVNDLLLIDIVKSANYYQGKFGSLSYIVQNSVGNPVFNARCIIDVVDGNDLPLIGSGIIIPTQSDGKVLHSRFIEDFWEPGIQYKWDIACGCLNTSGYTTPVIGSCIDIVTHQQITSYAKGIAQIPFMITDVADKMSVEKWDVEFSIPGVFVLNERGAKVKVENNPTYIAQEDINWSAYNNTVVTDRTQNGQGYLIAGENAKLCMIINNSFDKELDITVAMVTFDTDKEDDFFIPLDTNSGLEIDNGHNIMHTGVKNYDDENMDYVKCTEWFKIPLNIIGSNDWDIQAHISVEGYTQDFTIESDEFAIYGKRKDKDYLEIDNLGFTKTNYYSGEQLQICANITNYYSSRLVFELTYDIRCSKNISNDFETDRSTLIQMTEKRGVNSGHSQYQCLDSHIPFEDHLLYKSVGCYATAQIQSPFITRSIDKQSSKSSSIINITDFGYFPIYNVNPQYPSIKLFANWKRFDNLIDGVNRSYYEADINISPLKEEYLDPTGIIGDSDWDIQVLCTETMPFSQEHFNYTVLNQSGDVIENDITAEDIQWRNIGLSEHSRCAIGIEDINLSDPEDDYFKVRIWYEDFEERMVNATEAIAGSAGTFDFSITAADTTGSSTTVQGAGLTGQGNILNRDVQIKCWTIGYQASTLTTFEIYATDTFSFTSQVDVPSALGSYTMRCIVIDKYFGEDATPSTDTFSKTIAGAGKGGGGAIGQEIEKTELEKIKEVIEKLIKAAQGAPILTIIFMLLMMTLYLSSKDEEEDLK